MQSDAPSPVVLPSLIALAVFGATAASTPVVLRALHRLGAVDYPSARSSHERPTPRGGGIIVFALGVPAALAMLAATGSADVGSVAPLAVGVALGLLGAAEDLVGVPVWGRLAAEFIAASAFAYTFLGGENSSLNLVGALLIVVFVVAVTNIFNFMDGIDGIATGAGIAAFGTIFGLGVTMQDAALVAIGLPMMASAAGFLVWNWSPAQLFLGDAGSLFFGGVLGTMAVQTYLEVGSLLLVPPLLPFLVDGTLTLLHRAARGKKLTRAHRSHLYQRAARRWGHAPVALTYSLSAALLGVIGLYVTGEQAILVLATGTVILVSAWLALHRRLTPDQNE